MILDQLDQADLYLNLSDRIAAALRFLQAKDMTALSVGRHELDGEAMFALVQDYDTKHDAQVRWEAHHRYIDVQYVAAGAEAMGVADLKLLNVTDAYDSETDVLFAEGAGDKVTLRAGTFIVLFPNDAHRPGIAIDAPMAVRKVVVKVAV